MMRIVLMGTGPFAVPGFETLINSRHEIPALITRPLVKGRKASKQPPNPSRELGERFAIPIHDPPSINSPDSIELLNSLAADLFVVCDYGQILSREALGTARLGGINLHGSLLPKYRGAAPINWAIYNGDEQTGVTVIHMTAKLDGGPALATATIDIRQNEATPQVEERLAALGPDIVMQSIEMLESWDGESPIGELQDSAQTTKAPRLSKSDGQIDWSRTAKQICDQIRAFKPWPGTFTFAPRPDRQKNSEPLRLIVDEATWQPTTENPDDLTFGTVVISTKTELGIRCLDSVLFPTKVQPAGKRLLEIEEFQRGYSPGVGDRFGA